MFEYEDERLTMDEMSAKALAAEVTIEVASGVRFSADKT